MPPPVLAAYDNVLPEHTLTLVGLLGTCSEAGPPAGSSVCTDDLSVSPCIQDESSSQQGGCSH